MIKNFVCVRTGNKYGTMYVDKLYNMVTRHSNDIKFNVITDSKKDWRPEINQIVVSPLFPTWWNKIHMFRDDIGLEGRVLFMDLDIVVIRNIDHLWDFEGDAFVIIQDFNRCRIPNYHVRNSSVMKFNAGQEVHVWKKFLNDPQKIISQFRGDQDYMTSLFRQSPIWPRDWIMSYKWEIGLEPGEKKRSPHDKFVPEKFHKVKYGLPSECAVIVMHGKPNPAEVEKDPLIIDNWK